MTMLNKGLKPVLYDKDKAVSPIIATILLVAITVILASTLYLALGGFFSHTTSSTPTISLGATNTTSDPSTSLTYTITTGASSGAMPSWSSTSWVITFANGATVTLTNHTSNWTNGAHYVISGSTSSNVASGQTLVLTIKAGATYYNPTSIALMDTSSTGGGQMGTTSL